MPPGAKRKFRQDPTTAQRHSHRIAALRQRSHDIPLLVNHFVQKFAAGATHKVDGVSADAMAALKAYEWPGNIRELEHTIERAVLLGKGAVIGTDDLPPAMAKKAELEILMVQGIAKQFTLADLEREYIGKVLESTQGNKSEAAKMLGVDRTTLYRKLEEYKIKLNRVCPAAPPLRWKMRWPVRLDSAA